MTTAAKERGIEGPGCLHCTGKQLLVGGDCIYPNRPDLHDRMYWLCECGAYVGCHRGGKVALGKCADAATRSARLEAHAALDPLWNRPGCDRRSLRTKVYRRLADAFGCDEIHIGGMTREQALRVPGIVAKWGQEASDGEAG